MRKSKFIKAMWLLSMYLLLFWAVLGTGATLAWFSDTTPVAKNTFNVALMDLDVWFRNDTMTDYARLTENTPIFNNHAIYEPGYTQVVRLRIENPGDVEFQYKVAVNVNSYTTSLNKFGATFSLPPYLRYGVLFSASEAELDRALAQSLADQDMEKLLNLNTYSAYDTVTVVSGGARYVALVVYMPEETGNEANYKKPASQPYVDLGITIYAQQADTSMPQ